MKTNKTSQFAKPLSSMSEPELAAYNSWKANIDARIAKSNQLQNDAAMYLMIVVFPALLIAFCLLAF